MDTETRRYVGWVERVESTRQDSPDDARYDFVGEGRPSGELMRMRFRMLHDDSRPDYVTPAEFAGHVAGCEPMPLDAEIVLHPPNWTKGVISYFLADGSAFMGSAGEAVESPLDPERDLPECLRPQVPRLAIRPDRDRER